MMAITATIAELPTDVFYHIFNFVSTEQLYLTVANVCSQWRMFCSFAAVVRAKNVDGECTDLSALANAAYLPLNKVLKCLGYTFKGLKELSITATFELDDEKLCKVALNNPQFTHLGLYGCKHITSSGIEDACRMLPNLDYLDIRECPNITQQTATNLARTIAVVDYYNVNTLEFMPVKQLHPRLGQEKEFQRHCNTLMLPPNPTTLHLKKMYVRLSKEYHPDKQTSRWNKAEAHSKFIAIDVAYKYLSELAYDEV